VITTDSIKQPRESACGQCGEPCEPVLFAGADGKYRGSCCASPREAALVKAYNPDWELPRDRMAVRIAEDVLEVGRPGHRRLFPWGRSAAQFVPVNQPPVLDEWADGGGEILMPSTTPASGKKGLLGTE